MAFMDKLSEITKTIGDKTGDAVEIAKINTKIMSEKHSIEEAKKKLGELVYEQYKAGETFNDAISEILAEIGVHEGAIADLEASKEAVKED